MAIWDVNKWMSSEAFFSFRKGRETPKYGLETIIAVVSTVIAWIVTHMTLVIDFLLVRMPSILGVTAAFLTSVVLCGWSSSPGTGSC